MKTPFNPKGITLQLDSEQLTELYHYTLKCIENGFEGANDFEKFHSDREYFYKWMLRDLLLQLFNKAFKQIAVQQSRYKITIHQAHQKTLSVMFNRVEASPFLLTIQQKLLHQLTKTSNYE